MDAFKCATDGNYYHDDDDDWLRKATFIMMVIDFIVHCPPIPNLWVDKWDAGKPQRKPIK